MVSALWLYDPFDIEWNNANSKSVYPIANTGQIETMKWAEEVATRIIFPYEKTQTLFPLVFSERTIPNHRLLFGILVRVFI